MKLSGLVLMAVGLIAAIFAAIQRVLPNNPNSDVPLIADNQPARLDQTYLFAFAAGAFFVGIGMFLYGRSYRVTHNARARN